MLISWSLEIYWKHKVPSLQSCLPQTKTKQVPAMISSSRCISLWNVQRRWGSFNKLIQPLLFSTHTGGKGTFQEFWISLLFLFRSTWQHILHQLQQNSCGHRWTLWFAFSPFLSGNFKEKFSSLWRCILHTARQYRRLMSQLGSSIWWLSASALSTNLTFFKSLLSISEHLKYLAIVVLSSHEITKIWMESCKARRSHLQLTVNRLFCKMPYICKWNMCISHSATDHSCTRSAFQSLNTCHVWAIGYLKIRPIHFLPSQIISFKAYYSTIDHSCSSGVGVMEKRQWEEKKSSFSRISKIETLHFRGSMGQSEDSNRQTQIPREKVRAWAPCWDSPVHLLTVYPHCMKQWQPSPKDTSFSLLLAVAGLASFLCHVLLCQSKKMKEIHEDCFSVLSWTQHCAWNNLLRVH